MNLNCNMNSMKTRCDNRIPQNRNAISSRSLKFGASLVLGCWCLVISSFGQYSISWSTIDGGGGTSTGGVFSVSGTIGQPDANATPMIGGNFSLSGGFWSALSVVQTP